VRRSKKKCLPLLIDSDTKWGWGLVWGRCCSLSRSVILIRKLSEISTWSRGNVLDVSQAIFYVVVMAYPLGLYTC